jgi:hypothetical protein
MSRCEWAWRTGISGSAASQGAGDLILVAAVMAIFISLGAVARAPTLDIRLAVLSLAILGLLGGLRNYPLAHRPV